MRIDPTKMAQLDWGKPVRGAKKEDGGADEAVAVKAAQVPAGADGASEAAERSARLEVLRAQLASGEYQPDLEELARRLVDVVGRIK